MLLNGKKLAKKYTGNKIKNVLRSESNFEI